MKKILLRAFSLIELMVALIVVSVLTAAMAPVITKKLKSKEITISQGGGGLTMNCSSISPQCGLCEGGICVSCAKACTEYEALDVGACSCVACNDENLHGSACLKCDSENCSKCTSGYYLDSGVCTACSDGYTCDGTISSLCPVGYYCKDGATTPCLDGTYNDTEGATSSSSCVACSAKTPNCTNCDIASGACSVCSSGYEVKDGVCKNKKFEYEYSGSSSKTEYADSTVISFVSSGTLTIKSDAKGVVMVLGGGGGGQGGIYNSCGVCGGAGYSKISSDLEFYSGDKYSITIGAGGSKGTGSQYNATCGGTGGQTTFGAMTANGGNGCGTGGSAITFAETTYASGCAIGANTGTGGSPGGCWVSMPDYIGGWTGTDGGAGYSGIAVLKIYK